MLLIIWKRFVLNQQSATSAKIALHKCQWCKNQGCLQMAAHWTAWLQTPIQPHPSDPKHKEAHQCASELHSFLGVCKYWRKFSENYSDFAWPLTSLLKKDSPFLWHQNPQNWKYIEENVWQNMLCWWLLIQSSGQLNGLSRQSVWTVASPNLYTSNWAQVHRNTMAILITLHGL